MDSSDYSASSRRKVVVVDPRMISPITIFEDEVCSPVSVPRKTVDIQEPSPGGSDQKAARAKSAFNQKDDTGRKQRVKTELCMHIERGTVCPFGKECVFAHSEEELRLTKLLDLVRAGMVDGETFRVLPCETFVSTGSWYVLSSSCIA